jgi:hypothetical protein
MMKGDFEIRLLHMNVVISAANHLSSILKDTKSNPDIKSSDFQTIYFLDSSLNLHVHNNSPWMTNFVGW